jgi:hypothetical protein
LFANILASTTFPRCLRMFFSSWFLCLYCFELFGLALMPSLVYVALILIRSFVATISQCSRYGCDAYSTCVDGLPLKRACTCAVGYTGAFLFFLFICLLFVLAFLNLLFTSQAVTPALGQAFGLGAACALILVLGSLLRLLALWWLLTELALLGAVTISTLQVCELLVLSSSILIRRFVISNQVCLVQYYDHWHCWLGVVF